MRPRYTLTNLAAWLMSALDTEIRSLETAHRRAPGTWRDTASVLWYIHAEQARRMTLEVSP